MSLYFLSPQAAQDLQEINDYLFAGNPDVADRLLTLITQKLDILARFPSMGSRLLNSGSRLLNSGSRLLFLFNFNLKRIKPKHKKTFHPVPNDALSFDTSTSSVHRCPQLPLVVRAASRREVSPVPCYNHNFRFT